MTICSDFRAAVALGSGRGHWRFIGDEVWNEKGFLFYVKEAKLAEYLVRLHNLAIPACNLLGLALKRVKDLQKLLGDRCHEDK